MIFRTQNDAYEDKPTKFSTKTQLYKLDEVTGDLVEAGFQDDQALIQSNADTCLRAVLERFGYVPEEYLNIDLPQKWQPDMVDSQPLDMFPNQKVNHVAQSDKLKGVVLDNLNLKDNTFNSKQLQEYVSKYIQEEQAKIIANYEKSKLEVKNDETKKNVSEEQC